MGFSEDGDRPSHDRATCGGTCLPAFFDELEHDFDDPLRRTAMAMLRSQPDGFVSVGEWAHALDVSREHLTRAIGPTISPHALLQAARVSIALTRLAEQDELSAADALDAMGYNSRAHASAVFKRTTGMSPTQYWRATREHLEDHECAVKVCPLLRAMLYRHRAHDHPTAELP